MICRYCGKKIPDDASFCPACGKRLESHLRAEDRVEYRYEEPDDYDEYEEPKGKRRVKALISIIAAIIFVAAVFIGIMVFLKPYLGEEPWPDSKDPAAETEAEDEAAEEKSEFPKAMYVSAEDGLLLRKDIGQQNEAIYTLVYGQEIQVEKIEDGWAYTTVDGISGWCSTDYLTESKDNIKKEESQPESEEDKDKTEDSEKNNKKDIDTGKLVEPSVRIQNGTHGTVNSDGGLNLRCGPGAEYDILIVVPDKTEVVEEGRDGDWIYIKYGGQYGWVNSGYITPKE